jgi:hypothetical protein
MSADAHAHFTPVHFTRAHEALARQIAAADGRSYIDWPDLYAAAAARQVPPNPANAPQPTPPAPNLQNEPTHAPRPQMSRNVPVPSILAPRSTRQRAPSHANAPQPAQDCRTNPPPPSRRRPPRPLTPNQLRAARLLTQGHSTTAIATALHVDRHTLADWKRNPFFQQELRHLIDDPRPTTDN